MGNKTKIAIVVVAAALLAAGLAVYFHQPQKPQTTTPAAAAGIASGLTVSKVDGVSLDGKSLADCVNLIRGLAGTSVQLELVAPDGSRTNTVELTRRKLKL
jgi:carboxyl-terminal processing protease